MTKLGKFKGLPVYRLTIDEWQTMTTKDDESFYVVGDRVYYHDVKIANLNARGELCSLDEDEIISLRKRYEAMAGNGVAEVRPVVVEEPVHEEPEPVAATSNDDFDIDDFLKHGLFDLDGYIEELMNADLGVDYAVG